jgi:wyosine [tRNA(Phe)-imidazoG37] synthetase (radical SAM superfamily)
LRHVFGPVPSRRLGFSLGVDPVVPKTCTLDCVYCELGPTTDLTVYRTCYVDIDAILDELKERLSEPLRLDYITISGSGEPTLSSGIGPLIDGIRALTDVPVAVLTNGSLFTDPEVRKALHAADVVAPSLDAVSPEAFRRVNRPHPSLNPSTIAEAMTEFAQGFPGEIWLETLLVAGMNDDPGEIALLRRAIDAIAPARLHVNTIVRPPSVAGACAITAQRLREIASDLGPTAEVIAAPGGPAQLTIEEGVAERIIAMAARRPITARDVARAIGTSHANAAKMLSELVEIGRLRLVPHGGTQYYRA